MTHVYPLSAFQLPFWIEFEHDRRSARGNRAIALRIEGAVDVPAFERAWAEVVSRHDVLRATYRRGPHGPEHVIRPDTPGALTVEPLPDEAAIARRIQAAVDAPLDLERGPVIRGVLLVGATASVFSFISHHIQADVTIVDNVLAELGALYDHALGKGPALPPPPPASYADFVAEHAAILADATRYRALDEFWRARLEDLDAGLALPRDRPPRADGVRVPATHGFVLLDPAGSAALRDVCERLKCTRFRFLLACWFAFLARHGAEQVSVGMSVNRAGRKYDGTIGNYANVVPLSATVRREETVGALAARIAEDVRAASEHGDYPFTAASIRAAALGSEGGLGLFRTMFGFGKLHRSASLSPVYLAAQPLAWEGRLGSLRVVGSVPIHQHGLTVDIELLLGDVSGAVAAQLNYDAGSFEPSTVETFAARLRTLVAAALAAPETSIGALPLVTDEGRAALLAKSAGPDVPVAPTTVLEAFLRQATEAPDRTACIEPDGRAVRYGELADRARRIGDGLVRRGVRLGDRVGVLLPRGSDVLATFLGCWRAHAAYVPIDRTAPDDRVRRILEVAGTTCIVDEAMLAELLAEEPQPEERPLPDPASVAYVIFTSGTTGTPKGVVIEHLGVASYAADVGRRWSLDTSSRALAFASFAFDSSVSDWCGSFAAGGAVVIRGPELMGGAALAAFIAEHDVTHAHLPPAVWATLPSRPLPRLRVAVTSGDACPIEVVRTWAPGRTMINEYGPTEITVCATSAFCTPAATPDIGRPIANVRAYVLDERLEPVVDGVKGELVLGGIGLARGYLNDPALTSDRFVAVNFPHDTRVYRTGDLVVRRPDGSLVFLGRTDDQLKIRGHRVEPAEIEHALAALPGVLQAVVVGRRDVGAHVQLVAYYVASDADVGPTTLRDALRRALPSYLVPSFFVRLDAMPLTAHGKIARDLLPPPIQAETSEPRTEPAAPKATGSGFEEALEAWRSVLGQPTLAAEENFFESGGDSLMAVDLADRLSALFGTEVGVIDIFELPTARGWFDRHGATGSAAGPTVLREGVGRPIVLVPPPGGEPIVYRALLGSPPGRPLHVLTLAPSADLEVIVDDLARQIGEDATGLVIAGWSVGGVLAHALVARLERNERRPQALVLFDAYPPADVAATIGADAGAEHRGGAAAKELIPLHLAAAMAYAPGALRTPIVHLRAKASAAMPDRYPEARSIWVDATHETVLAEGATAFADALRALTAGS